MVVSLCSTRSVTYWTQVVNGLFVISNYNKDHQQQMVLFDVLRQSVLVKEVGTRNTMLLCSVVFRREREIDASTMQQAHKPNYSRIENNPVHPRVFIFKQTSSLLAPFT